DADFSQCLDIRLVARPAGTAAGWRSTLDDGFHQGVPGPAVATLPGPLGKGRAALGAAVDALGLGHGNSRVGKGSCMIAAGLIAISYKRRVSVQTEGIRSGVNSHAPPVVSSPARRQRLGWRTSGAAVRRAAQGHAQA